MKNLLKNKKLLATLGAGVLLLTLVLGGTYAWLTSTDQTGTDNYQTASVDVVAEAATGYKYNALSHVTQVPFIRALEAMHLSSTAAADFAAFLDNPINAMTILDVITPGYTPNVGDFTVVKNAFGTPNMNVTPGSFVGANYNFDVSDSTIPVYFRISAAELTGNLAAAPGTTPVPIYHVQRATAKITGGEYPPGTPFELEVDLHLVTDPLNVYSDYYYCAMPLDPTIGYKVEINVLAYVFGDPNRAQFQNITFNFGAAGNEAEVIQATDLAVYLADEWEDAANVVNFVPYYDALHLQQLYLALAFGIDPASLANGDVTAIPGGFKWTPSVAAGNDGFVKNIAPIVGGVFEISFDIKTNGAFCFYMNKVGASPANQNIWRDTYGAPVDAKLIVTGYGTYVTFEFVDKVTGAPVNVPGSTNLGNTIDNCPLDTLSFNWINNSAGNFIEITNIVIK